MQSMLSLRALFKDTVVGIRCKTVCVILVLFIVVFVKFDLVFILFVFQYFNFLFSFLSFLCNIYILFYLSTF